jgi:elongation factor 3
MIPKLFTRLKPMLFLEQLVEDPMDAAVFLPKLLPDLEKVSKDVSDPECREVCERARATLTRIGGSGAAKKAAERAVPETIEKFLVDILGADVEKVDGAVVSYIASLAVHLVDAKAFEKSDWDEVQPCRVSCPPFF